MTLIVDRYELGQTRTNCYVVRADRVAAEAVVIDPGSDAAQLRLELAALDTRPAAILITHGHWDHLGAVADLAEASSAPVYMADAEAVVLEDPRSWFPEIPIRPHGPEVRLEGNETFEVAGISFRTLRVPGHSPAHLAYYADGALFSGDVLMAGGVGRTDLPYGDWDTLVESIRMLMESFPPETVVYAGHGPPTTLGAELARNPFLAELRTAP